MGFEVWLLLPVAAVAVAGWLFFWMRYRATVANVTFLFNAIDNGDYSFRFPEEKGFITDRGMNRTLNRVKDILVHARDEQMEREKYFELIMNSVDTGIIVVEKERGVVMRYNNAAQKMFHREVITHIGQISGSLNGFSTRESTTVLNGHEVRIIAFSDIKGELANQEIDSWIKLTRVLTHEIMNTVTPIVSLSDTLLRHSEGEQHEGLKVISRTGKELVRFVENYRKFTHVPVPEPKLFYVKPFLERMSSLAGQILKRGCIVEIDVRPKDLIVYADEGLISRVVSNLVKNAAEALPEGGHLWLNAYTGENDSVVVDVVDDGPMIPDDIAAHIFIPFFTTKKDGSGIGLSISRQIMRVSNGFISLVTDRKKRLTIFRLVFN